MPTSRYPHLYKFLRRLTAACGWILYVYEWVHVSWETPRREPVTFALLLVAGTLLMHATIAAWIAHNKRLAARGARGQVTRYTVPSFSRDYLGREIVLHEASWSSQEVIVRVDGGRKFYLPAPAAYQAPRRPRKSILPAERVTKVPTPEMV
jgi:hypothetical protein